MARGLTVVRWAWPLLALPAVLWGQQYQANKAGPPPAELAPAIAQALGPGFQITNNRKAYCEIWLRTSLPPGARSTEQNVTLADLAPGALVGAMRFDGEGSDRRGQVIQPGVYLLRYGVMPANDDHQGAARQRDFLLLTPAAEDRDLNATFKFDALMALSRRASLTSHPAVLSVWRAKTDSPGFSQQGDSDWVLEAKAGETPMAIVVAGAADH